MMQFNWKKAGLLWYFAEDTKHEAISLMEHSEDAMQLDEIEEFYGKSFVLGRPSEGELGGASYTLSIEDIEDYMEELREYPVYRVYTSSEAAKIWALSENTVTKWCNRGKFKEEEARKSNGTWLISYEGMVRVTSVNAGSKERRKKEPTNEELTAELKSKLRNTKFIPNPFDSEKKQTKEYTLQELLDECNPENRHKEIDLGVKGKELL
ncbi:helix-turn-helix domain-containing protein [Bacillus paranthracis]|uniref:helix-turn-helix domain-containing protein n=1 Tax=Bacillus paranthracis TaxID=2026186 RepID=UPI0020B64AD1|nr:helix-turn-helix domain-containing protein [Bacillus paranthracis]